MLHLAIHLAGFKAPKAQRAVRAAGDDLLAIGGDGVKRSHDSFVSFEFPDQSDCAVGVFGKPPEADDAVGASAGNLLSPSGPSDRVHFRRCVGLGEQRSLGDGPNAKAFVRRTRAEVHAIGREL